MSAALDTITSWAIAPGPVLTPVTNVGAGDSLRVRDFNSVNSRAYLFNVWTFQNVAGEVRIRSPLTHDYIDNLRIHTTSISEVRPNHAAPLLNNYFSQELKSNDILTVEILGSAAPGDIEVVVLQTYYENLPNVNQRLISVEELRARAVDYMTLEDAAGLTLVTGGLGGYDAASTLGVATVNGSASMKYNADYALIGYEVFNPSLVSAFDIGGLTLRGIDTGGLRIAMPGCSYRQNETAGFFIAMSEHRRLPLIPVFNQRNIPGTVIEAISNQFVGMGIEFTLFFVRLRS